MGRTRTVGVGADEEASEAANRCEAAEPIKTRCRNLQKRLEETTRTEKRGPEWPISSSKV